MRITKKCKTCGKFEVPEEMRDSIPPAMESSICTCAEAGGVLVIKEQKMGWGAEIALFIALSICLSPIGWGIVRLVMLYIHNKNQKKLA